MKIPGGGVIWKFKCPKPGHTENITMPKGAWFTRVIRGYFWAVVDPDAKKEIRVFSTIGTGQQFQGGVVGSWDEGPFVWHLIEQQL